MFKAIGLSIFFHFSIFFLFFYVYTDSFSKNNLIMDISVDIITSKEFKKIAMLGKKKKVEKEIEKDKRKIEDKKPEKPKEKKKKPEKEEKKVIKKKPVIDIPNIEGKKKEIKQEVKVKKVIKKIIKKKKKPKKIKKKKVLKEDFNDVLLEFKKVQNSEEEHQKKQAIIYKNSFTPSEKVALRTQINNCWRNIAQKIFNKDEIKDIKIDIIVKFNDKGQVISAKLADNSDKYLDIDGFLYRRIADTALSTFYKCNYVDNLPVKKYNVWKELKFTFDPNDL